MRVTLEIPDSVVKPLNDFAGPDLGRAALERLAIDGYKAAKLSHYQVQQLLGHDTRWDTEAWLASQGLDNGYTLADLEEDRKTIEKLLGSR